MSKIISKGSKVILDSVKLMTNTNHNAYNILSSLYQLLVLRAILMINLADLLSSPHTQTNSLKDESLYPFCLPPGTQVKVVFSL